MNETLRLQARIDRSGAVRYIKLGVEGAAAQECLAANVLALGFPEVPEDICCARDWDAVRAHFIAAGKTVQKASDHTREIRDFYTLDETTLWITFVGNKMYWAFADPEVTRDERAPFLKRRRRVRGAWRSDDFAGRPLLANALSTRLTRVRAYRSTICDVAAADYLLRRINGETDPLIAEAEAATAAMCRLAAQLIRQLHEKEFEVLVDLVFAHLGWRRISLLGETQADIDLLAEQPLTGERAFVQVKSSATPAVLDDYMERFASWSDCDRFFFVCHSPSTALAKRVDAPNVELWFAEEIAAKTVRAGLFDWLIERVR